MRPEASDTVERSPFLRWIMIGSSALGLGCLLASLTVLDLGKGGIEFHWSNYALIAFPAGAGLAAGYWLLVFRLGEKDEVESGRRTVYGASIFMLLLAVAVFMYPLRFITPEKRSDVLIGLGIAVCALSCVGFMIRTVVKMLEEEDAANPPPPLPHGPGE